jgi:agmatinase
MHFIDIKVGKRQTSRRCSLWQSLLSLKSQIELELTPLKKVTDAPTVIYQPAVGGSSTFSNLPQLTNAGVEEVDLAFLGIPFDGLVTYRPGARFGPRAIRQSSVLCRGYSPQLEVGVYERLRAFDAGDVNVNLFDYEETFRQIETRVVDLQQRGAAVVSLGGDHSILLPILRATSRKYPNLTLIQFDAHSDTSDATSGHRHHHGTSIRSVIEEGLVRGDHIFQIGIRGSIASAAYQDYAKGAGIRTLDMQGFHQPETHARFLETLREVAGANPCYLTFDIDGVDPAFAPGTGTPAVGGLTSFEALNTLCALKGLHFIGGDVVEVAPAYDSSEITSLLAAAIAFELAALIALARAAR